MNFDYPVAFSAVKLIAMMARFGAFLTAVPFFSTATIPGRYKILFILAISVLLMPAVPDDWMTAASFRNLDLFSLSFMVLSEVVLGLTIALFILIFMEIVRFGGFIMDRDMGFIMASVFDPGSETDSTPFSHLLVESFLILFLIFDGHHEIIRLAAYSFQTIPPGGFIPSPEMGETLITLSSRIFLVGMQMAFPVFAAMFILCIAMGITARIGEDFPVLELSFAVRFALGFSVVIGALPVIISISRQMNTEMLEWVAGLAGF